MILHDKERIGIKSVYWNETRHIVVPAQEKDREKQRQHLIL
jgi:hypothetical protein